MDHRNDVRQLKTKGFNLEDTRIADPGKLSTLLAVLALTVTPRVKTGAATLRKSPRPRSLLKSSPPSTRSHRRHFPLTN
ncbi:MAG: hypothetical protein ACT4O2_09285 [Beijerinckiaceae bacterium]